MPNQETMQTWGAGWYLKAKKQKSANYNARPDQVEPELIVIHSISLPPGEYGNGYVARLFLNEIKDWAVHPYLKKIEGLKVSSHFVIDRLGRLTQYVSCDERAWHAGQSCWQGRDNCNDWSIGIELEGLEGDAFEAAQYVALTKLITAICHEYPIRWIAGHEHIAPERKHDPGAGFDWGGLMKQMTTIGTLGQEAFPPPSQLKK